MEYRWDFGDGSSETTTTSEVVHSFPFLGDFPVSVQVIDNDGAASPVASITVRATGSLEAPSESFGANVSGFDEWSQSYFSTSELNDPGISGPLAVPLGDNVPNLTKFATGLDPRNRANARDVSVVETEEIKNLNYLVLSYNRRLGGSELDGINYVVDGLNYSVEVSDDLINWSSVDSLGQPLFELDDSPVDAGNGYERVRIRSKYPITTGSSEKSFLRLKIQLSN